MARIYDGVTHSDKLRVCFDTCHTHDAGYAIVDKFDDVIDEFDHIIGKDQIAVFHINDSKNERGAGKDRHENVGFGTLGYDTIRKVVFDSNFENIPKILETPYIPMPNDKKKAFAPYRWEIAMLKEGVFDSQLKEKILEEALNK